jgi:hypothetical protein
MSKAHDSAVDFLDFADPAAPVDLLATNGKPSRRIRPLATGTLSVKVLDGTVRTVAVTANVDEDIQAISLEAATTIATRVYW